MARAQNVRAQDYIRKHGQREVARQLSVNPGTVHSWLESDRPIVIKLIQGLPVEVSVTKVLWPREESA